jgi:signal transduction histidine kinase
VAHRLASGAMTAQGGTADADGRWRRIRRQLLAVVLRPTARPLGWGIVVAVAFIVAEAGLVLLLKRTAPDNSYGAIFLLGVLVVAAGWNFGLALATSLASAAVYVYFHVEDGDNLIPAFFVFLPLALLASVLASQARLRAAESEERRREANALAQQQAALRRVATLVARGAKPADLYPVAVTELARGLACEHVTLIEFDADDRSLVLATLDTPGPTKMEVGESLPLDGDSLSGRIRESGEPARIDDYQLVDGTIAARLRDMGLYSGVGAPITVDESTRGALIIGTAKPTRMSSETEARIGDFADLVATAIANAETRAELRASRARVVAAADQARRGIERDLHDGAQQRIVSLGLGLRTLEATIPPEQQAMRKQVDNLVTGMADLYTELQEVSRGIHPAILSKGGLGPALKTLARRSTVPVTLHLDVDGRLPESIEVAAYYVVAEALTNAAKHSRAAGVSIRAGFDGGDLLLEIADDGVGGASPGAGSGLIGLKDRVDAVSGRLVVTSPPSGGTTISARIPVDAD